MSLRATARLAGVLSLMIAPCLGAQDSAKGPPTAVLRSGPDVGRRAPSFRLPWANKDGIGPAESPYDLSLDLGRTVVLAFYPRDFTESSTLQMRTFAEQYDSLFGPEVVVVGIGTESLDGHSRFAASLDLPFRLLSDPQQQVARRYGSNDKSGFARRTVYVVGPDGRVHYRNTRFDPRDPKQYAELAAAVRRTRGG
jgi:peroxiredoxin Q/BCP